MTKKRLIFKKREGTSKPRFVILKNCRGLLAGIDYHDLDSICNMAAIYAHAELKKEKDFNNKRWYQKMLWILDALKNSRDEEFDRSYSPKPERPLIDRLRENEKQRQWWKTFMAKTFPKQL